MNRRILLSGLIVVCIGCLSAATAIAASGPPLFVKFQVSDQCSVYAKIQGEQMRLAATAEGLDSARVVGGSKDTRFKPPVTQFKETDLPFEAGTLPAGYGPVKASVSVHQTKEGKPFLQLQLRVSKKDEKNVLWTYEVTMGASTGDSADTAPGIAMPALEKGEIAIVAVPKGQEMGIGVRVKADQAQLSSIRCNGREVDTTVKVMDSTGKEVKSASAKGPLSKFGFG